QLGWPATMAVDGEHLNLSLDGGRLAELVTDKVDAIGETPQDAQIVLRDGEPEIIPAGTGTGLDPDELAQAVREAAVDPDSRTASGALAETAPDFSTSDAEDRAIR